MKRQSYTRAGGFIRGNVSTKEDPLRNPFRILAFAVLIGFVVAPLSAGEGRQVKPDPLAYVSPSRPYRSIHTSLDLDFDLERQAIAGSVTRYPSARRWVAR